MAHAGARLLLGLDLGTTGTKATLLDPGSGTSWSASRPSSLLSDRPGCSEADTAQWWSNVCTLVPEVLSLAGASASDVAALACSGMVPAVVVLDADGRPLRRAILQNDARAVTEIPEVAASLEAAGFDPLERTGSALTQQSVAPTWLWLARHDAEVVAQAAHVVGSYDWLAIALGARPHVELNWAIESGLFELAGTDFGNGAEPGAGSGAVELRLAEASLRACGIARRLLPDVLLPGTIAGEVSCAAAASCGLTSGTPIVTGGADHVLAAWAAGLSEAGDWLVKLGGAGDILVVADAPVIDRRWYLDAHPAPGRWLPNGCMATSGSLLRWIEGIFGGQPLHELDALAAAAEPASVLCLPYFLGEKSPFHDPDLRGAFAGLHLGTGRGELFRACLEAVAFGFRDHVRCMAERGIVLGTARVSNGGSGSTLWKQILADVLGAPLHPVVDHGGASLGAALAAGVATGALTGWGDAARYVRLADPVEPRADLRERYDAAYGTFGRLQAALQPISHELAARSRA